MRPLGDVRQALETAFGDHGPCTWRNVLPAAGINTHARAEVLLVRRTVENMVRDGALVRCGAAKVAGSRNWHALYERVPDSQAPTTLQHGLDALEQATRSWAQFS